MMETFLTYACEVWTTACEVWTTREEEQRRMTAVKVDYSYKSARNFKNTTNSKWRNRMSARETIIENIDFSISKFEMV